MQGYEYQTDTVTWVLIFILSLPALLYWLKYRNQEGGAGVQTVIMFAVPWIAGLTTQSILVGLLVSGAMIAYLSGFEVHQHLGTALGALFKGLFVTIRSIAKGFRK